MITDKDESKMKKRIFLRIILSFFKQKRLESPPAVYPFGISSVCGW